MNKLELVQAWQAETEMPVEQSSRVGHKGSGIFHLQLTPDDRYALTLNFQYRELIIWDFASGKQVSKQNWGGYDKVRGLYLTPDGRYAVVTGETGGVISIDPDQPNPKPGYGYKIVDDQGQTYQLPSEDYVIVNAQSRRAISSNGRQTRMWDFEKQYFTVPLEIPAIRREDDIWDPLRIHAISSDGRFGSGMFDNHVLVWNLESGQVLWHRDFGQQAPNLTLFTPDGQQIVLKFMSRVETWRWSINQMDGPAFDTPAARRLRSPVFTPDGQTLITGSDNGTIQAWDWPTGHLKQTLAGHRHAIRCLAVSADGEYLASTGEDTTLRKWHLASGKQVFSTLRATKQTEPLAIDPDGRYVISPYGYDKATLAIFDLVSGVFQRTLQGHQGDINAIDFLSAGRLISASDDHTLRVWDLESEICLQILRNEHTDSVQTVVTVPKPDRAVSAGADGQIIRWDLSTGRPVRPPVTFAPPTSWTEQYMFIDQRGHFAVTNKAYSGDERKGTPILLDLESGLELELRTRLPGSYAGGMLSPGGRWLIQPFGGNRLKIIHLATKQITQIQVGDDDQARLGDIWCFSPDDKTLVCSYYTEEFSTIATIGLNSATWRLSSIKALPFGRESRGVSAIALSSDSRLGAIAIEGHIRVFELSNGEELASFNTGHLFSLVFDPKNRYLVAGGYNTPLCCFELRALSD